VVHNKAQQEGLSMTIENSLWTERYRPKTLADYVWVDDAQRHQVETWVRDGDVPHLILSGGPGCGKSTMAMMLMNELGVSSSDVKFINASHHRGIDVIRGLTSFAETMPMGKFRYVILDEADQITPDGQAALKSMIEEYSQICRWILTTNNPHKIISPLHSRMQGFHITALDREQYVTRVASILIQEGVDVTEENLEILDEYVSVAFPDLRKCINMLQQNCQGGVLRRPNGTGSSGFGEYMVEAVGLFKRGKIHEGRKILCANASDGDWEEIYRILYRNIDWWGDTEDKQNRAIVIIANRLRDHAICADSEMNMAACLIELSMIAE